MPHMHEYLQAYTHAYIMRIKKHVTCIAQYTHMHTYTQIYAYTYTAQVKITSGL